MSQTFGIEKPEKRHGGPLRAPARYLVLVDPSDQSSALLFNEARTQMGEFSAASEEVAVMTKGLVPERTAGDPAWDDALGQYSPQKRAAAEVYTLDI